MKKVSFLKIFAVFFFSFASVLCTSAANIRVKGAVKDKLSKEPLIGATIRLIGTQAGTVTDMEGNFELAFAGAQAGVYDIEIKYVGYKTEIRKEVRMGGSSPVVLNLELETDAHELADVVVVAKKNRENEHTQMLERQKAVIAIQTVGVKELSRKGVSDAEGAVAKVSGVSKQEGVKNVFVRGLGDRYNATTFNGFALPSEDPEYKNISLDFFGTDIIQSVGVNKAFHARGGGDVGGAAIDIVSKELTGDVRLGIHLSGGINTQTVSEDFLLADGADFRGMANRKEPAEGSGWNFDNRIDPQKQRARIDSSLGISGGKCFYIGDAHNPLSLFFTAAHTTNYRYTDERLRGTTTDGTVYKEMEGKKYAENISQLALANVSYAIGSRHHLSYNLMYVHATTRTVGDYRGQNPVFSDDYGNLGMLRRQQINDNRLLVNQLITQWSLTEKLSLDAGAAYNLIKGYEPDRRINHMTQSAGGYSLVGGNAQQRYYSALDDTDLNIRAGLVYAPEKPAGEGSEIRLGYMGRFVDDGFLSTEYNMPTTGSSSFASLTDFSLDEFYTPANYAAGRFGLDKNIDEYSVRRHIHSIYAEATCHLLPRLVANLGLKYDKVDMRVVYDVNRGGSKGANDIRKEYFLPSLNLKYSPAAQHSLRLGASRTYTLPQSKEISPYRYVGVHFSSQGNASLKPSDNYNIDLRWDFNPTPTELLSLTAFYKHIAQPISRIEVASAGGYLSYENIADHATVTGLELEVRKNLFVGPVGAAGSHKLSAGLNGSYIYTNARVPLATVSTGSRLEGAAPWIGNMDLSHHFSRGECSFTNTLVLGYVGKQVYTIGTQGYQDIMAHAILTLDFVSQAKLNKHISLNLKAKNLLNPSYKLSRKAANGGAKSVLSDYKEGVNISLGVSCTF